MRALLRQRDVRLLFTGLAVGMAGDSLMLLVFAIWVKTLTGSTGAAGLVLLFLALPYAASPFGGWLVDRFRRRPFLITVNAASALMLLPLLFVGGRGDVWIIYLTASLYGVSGVTTASALNGLFKELLAEDALAEANGAVQAVREGLRLGGPLAGAALFGALGGAAVAAIDAATFLVTAVAIATMRLRERRPHRTALRWRDELTAGLRHLTAEPVLRRAVTAGAIAWSVVGFAEAASIAVVDQGLHRPPAFLGVLASAQGAGCVVAGLTVARITAKIGELATTAIGLAAFGAGCGLCVPPVLAVVLAGRAVGGVGLTLTLVGFATLLQRRTPQPLIGRVTTAAETMTSGPQLVSLAAGAALISVLGYRVLLAVILAGMLTAAAYLWPARRLTAPARPEAVRLRRAS